MGLFDFLSEPTYFVKISWAFFLLANLVRSPLFFGSSRQKTTFTPDPPLFLLDSSRSCSCIRHWTAGRLLTPTRQTFLSF